MMGTASAPYLNECSTCKYTFEDFKPDVIKSFEINFGDVKDCRVFISNYERNPYANLDQCAHCLRSKWRNIRERKEKYTENADIRYEIYYNKIYVILTVVLVSCLFGYIFGLNFLNNNYDHTNDVSEAKLKFTITKLKDQFPSLRVDLLKKIVSAFKRLKTPGEPFVFLLLHDDTNKKTTDCLASYTSVVAKQNIFTNTSKSLWMNASEWAHYSDHDGQNLIHEKLIAPLEENEVLVLENLQDLPWSLAKSFHYLCDSENPQISKAMYILVLRVDSNGHLQQFTDSDKLVVAERTMTAVWQDAPYSFRQALITRLTSYVDAVLLKSDDECLSKRSDESFIRVSP